MQLEELVLSYGAHNAEAKDLKKVCDAENAQIKEIMVSDGLTEFTSGIYTAKYSVSKQESLNEEKALEILKKDWMNRNLGRDIHKDCPYIKTKEYIDMDALETVLYKGDIPQETLVELDGCRIVKEIPKLTIVKAKGDK